MFVPHAPSRRPASPALRLFLLLGVCLALLPAPALAAGTTVVTNTNDAGPGSLRQALANADALPGADTITFDPAVFGTTPQTITLTSGNLTVTTDVTIQGPGQALLTVNGNSGGSRNVFGISSGTVAIGGLTVTGGYYGLDGGGIFVGQNTVVTLTSCTITGNTGSFGGGIFNQGALTLTNCTIAGNSGGFGGGIGNGRDGSLTMTNCTVAGNTASSGDGGGISSDGPLTMTNCTVAGNTASFGNGGGGNGGGIENSAMMTLTNCTVEGNTARTNGGGILSEFSSSILTLQASIVARNSLAAGSTGTGPDINSTGTVADNDSNLIGDNTGGPTFTGAHDQVGTAASPIDPKLGPLQDNGGPTPTMALLAGSPAIDADFSAAPPATDQRGVARPQGARSDIGAFEAGTISADTTPPTTVPALSAASYFNGFFRGAVTVTLSAMDPSGIAGTFYRVDSGPQQTYAGPFTVTGDFDHLVTFYSIDGAGNAEAPAKSATFSIDSTPPVTTITSRPIPGGQEVTLAARDNFSGPGGTFFRVDSGPLQVYTAPFIVRGAYDHLVTAYSIDRAGNAEGPAKSLAFTLGAPPPPDTTAPVTAPALSGPSYVNGFYRGPVTVTLTATDDRSGVARTFYRIDSGALRTYAGPFTVSGNFMHLATFYSVDNAGNAEGPARSVTFAIDTAPPVTTLTSRAVSGGREVTLAATDDFSGPGGTFYRVDSGPLQSYSGPFVVTGTGAHLVTAYSLDRALNAEADAQSLTFDVAP